LTAARTNHTATLLSDGKVLIVGGFDGSQTLGNSDIYDPSSQIFVQQSGEQIAIRNHTATLLQGPSAGYLRISSATGMLFRELHGATGARTAFNGIDVTKYAGVTKIFSPKFTTLAGEKTNLNVINANSSNDANVTITLHASDGSILGTPLARFLPRNAQINDDLLNIFQNDPAVQGQTGWIEVSSSVDYIVGTVSFSNSSQTFLTTYELSGTPLSRFLFPLAAEDASVYQTGIFLLNNNSLSATVQIELWGEGGTMERSTTVILAPNARMEGFLADYFPGLAPRLSGYIRVQSDRPVQSNSVLKDRNLKFACAVTPIAFPE